MHAKSRLPRYAKAGEYSSWPLLFRVINFTLLTRGVVVSTVVRIRYESDNRMLQRIGWVNQTNHKPFSIFCTSSCLQQSCCAREPRVIAPFSCRTLTISLVISDTMDGDMRLLFLLRRYLCVGSFLVVAVEFRLSRPSLRGDRPHLLDATLGGSLPFDASLLGTAFFGVFDDLVFMGGWLTFTLGDSPVDEIAFVVEAKDFWRTHEIAAAACAGVTENSTEISLSLLVLLLSVCIVNLATLFFACSSKFFIQSGTGIFFCAILPTLTMHPKYRVETTVGLSTSLLLTD